MQKEKKVNLAAVLGIAAIIVSCLLMLLPGQFANLGQASKEFNLLNGYEFLFNTFTRNGTVYHFANNAVKEGAGNVLPAGIIIIVLFVLAIVSFILNKKSSSLLLLGGVLTVTASVFFFAMEANAVNIYGIRNVISGVSKDTYKGVIQWVSYVNGSLLILTGGFAIYKSIILMINEAKMPDKTKGPSYNYLKK